MLKETDNNPLALVCHLTLYSTIFFEVLGTLVMPPSRTSISGSKSSGYNATFDAQMNR